MIKFFLILLVALALEAVGVVYLSKAVRELGSLPEFSTGALGRLALRCLGNGHFWLGLLLELIFFILLLVLLHGWDVSLVWPLTSLGFVLTTLAAKYIRHEDISAVRWGGVFLIMAGAALVAYSQKMKPPLTAPPSAASNANMKSPG